MAYPRWYRSRRRYRRSYGRRPYTPVYVPRRTVRRRPVRKAKARSVTKSQTCSCTPDMTPADKFVVANLDPFSPKAVGAKIPDQATMPSVACTLNQTYSCTLTTGTNTKAWAFYPSPKYGIIPATEGASSWTWPVTFTAAASWTKSSDFSNQFEVYRPVAHGIRVSSPVAPTSATGFVHIAVALESNYGITTWPFPTSTADLSGYAFYKRVTLASLTQSPLTLINKFSDETAFRYTDPESAPQQTNSGATTFSIPLSWGALLIAVEGVGSTNPLNLEMILHTEAIPHSNSTITGTPAAPYNAAVQAGVSHMSANTDAFHTEEQDSNYLQEGLATFAEGARAGASEIANRFLRPLLYNAGRGFVQYAAGNAMRGIGGVNNNPMRLAL